MNKKAAGNRGESIAKAYLKKIGYKIIETNFRYSGGEIDIIALDKEVTVYIEVKYRSNLNFGFPAEAVTAHKMHKIVEGARNYSLIHHLANAPQRFDVIEILGDEINHIVAAFEA